MDTILVVNAGSSSIKFQIFEVAGHGRLNRRLKGQIDGIGSRPRLRAIGIEGRTIIDTPCPTGEAGDVPAALDKVVKLSPGPLRRRTAQSNWPSRRARRPRL